MKLFTLFLAIFLLATATTGFAQFRNVDVKDDDISKEVTIVRLTPEMFSDQLYQPDFTLYLTNNHIQTETKTTQAFLYIGSEIVRKKFDLGFFTPAPYPRTVTEYSNAVRRQMFDAEPTSQQRRSPSLFRFN